MRPVGREAVHDDHNKTGKGKKPDSRANHPVATRGSHIVIFVIAAVIATVPASRAHLRPSLARKSLLG